MTNGEQGAGDGERRLVEAARRGDHRAFEALVIKYQDRSYRVVQRMVGASDAVDDARRSIATVEQTIVRDTEPNGTDGKFGFGMGTETMESASSRLALRDRVVSSSHTVGLELGGAEAPRACTGRRPVAWTSTWAA